MAQLEVLSEFVVEIDKLEHALAANQFCNIGELYCDSCHGRRRMFIKRLFMAGLPNLPYLAERYTPSAHQLSCVQCSTQVLAVIFSGPSGSQLALLRPTLCGATAHTPPAVAYYLDQAARAQGVGALSAAVVMYRSALEHLLHDQGFKEDMCGKKIAALEKGVKDGTAPRWARDLNPEDLRVLNRLGNGAVHTNGGDITKQQEIDHDLVTAVALTFEGLLEMVYERPKKDEERRKRLAEAAGKLK
jgi:hypothetical protein